MKFIKLTKGKFAKIDDDDFNKINKFRWRAHRSFENIFYAMTKDSNGRRISMHRFIMNPKQNEMIDHKNHDTLDNRKSNLRICSQSDNKANSVLYKNNKTGFKGVYFRKSRNSFIVKITSNGKCFRKRVRTPLEGARVYDEMAKKIFGEFALLNNK